MMLRAKPVNSTQTIVYNYFIRQGSITKTQGDKEKIRKNLEDRMKIIETYSAYFKQSLNVFPLSLADQGKLYIRKARLINLSPRTAMLLLYYKNLIRK